MVVEEVSESCTTNSKYHSQFYTVAIILERVIDCFHTIVTDETNPYHPPLSWLSRKQPKPPREEIFLDLIEECCQRVTKYDKDSSKDDHLNQIIDRHPTFKRLAPSISNIHLSSSLQYRLEKIPIDLRRSICSKTKDGCAPLFIACRVGHFNIVKYILDNCDPNIEQRGIFEALEDHHVHLVSPLWVAAVSGYIEIVQLLIDYGADVNSLTDSGSTPLRSVCFKCREDESNDSTHQPSRDNELYADTHQLASVESDDVFFNIAKLLLKNGADVNKPNLNGGTCLINAIHNYRLVEYLIGNGAHVDSSDSLSRTALHYAIQQGRQPVTKLLLQKGANPMLRANFSDDALQLSCITGNEEIFNCLIHVLEYPRDRLIDSYKLLGSSVLELRNDQTAAREYWAKALELQAIVSGTQRLAEDRIDHPPVGGRFIIEALEPTTPRGRSEWQQPVSDIIHCDKRRQIAYGADTVEVSQIAELQRLSVDEMRIQSLLISERVLGTNHRELIQRLLYRGTYYVNSLRPERCVDLWTYALRLRLKHDSIFHFESIFAAQALTKLFLDMLGQSMDLRFEDVYDVLQLLASQLAECRRLLNVRPTYRLHDEVHDLLLDMIVNLLLVLLHTSHKLYIPTSTLYSAEQWSHRTFNRSTGPSLSLLSHSLAISGCDVDARELAMVRDLVARLVSLGPWNSRGDNLLHVALQPSALCSESAPRDRLRWLASSIDSMALLERLIHLLLDLGLPVDSVNREQLSGLQLLCLAPNVQPLDKQPLIRLLIGAGAHVDRRAPKGENQRELIFRSLRDAGVDPMRHITLSCLAARSLALSPPAPRQDPSPLTPSLRRFIASH